MRKSVPCLVLCLMITIVMTSCVGNGGNPSDGNGADTTIPTVISVSPFNNATNVSTTTQITAIFSEAMLASSITSATFSVAGVSGTVLYSGLTATFTPTVPLAYNSTYTVTLTTGVKDQAENAMAGNYTWHFTTAAQSQQDTTVPLTWTWVGGSNTINQTGVYGTKGIVSASNVPGARELATACTDSNGNLWLFGGSGYEATGGGVLNDLWKFDGTNWTWVSGSDTAWHTGIYGTMGIASATNVPGDRYAAVSWCDKSGNFWLFGGNGLDSLGNQGDLSDLWKFDGTNWTWISGANTIDQSGVYGTKGAASPSNVPGARFGATSWTDSDGNLWLFGGWFSYNGTSGSFNDLWKFDGSNWTWVSGSDTTKQKGVYGTKGISSASNVPGARGDAIAWTDQSGNLWLFGGGGLDSVGNGGGLNDLWEFDGTNWTWVSGSDTVSQAGVYGTKGTASPSNVPGARSSGSGSIGTSGDIWLFGGYGVDSLGNSGYLNDLWKFDGTNWTWISGPDTIDQLGVYGLQGTASASNVPGARSHLVSWTDKSGNFWLFGGGTGYDCDVFNDLWFFEVP